MKNFLLSFYYKIKNFSLWVIFQHNPDAISQSFYVDQPPFVVQRPQAKVISRPQRLSYFIFKNRFQQLRRQKVIKLAKPRRLSWWVNLPKTFKLWLLTYYNRTSLDGYHNLRSHLDLIVKLVVNFQTQKAIFILLQKFDWLSWRWWFLLTIQDLKVEYLKQYYFLYYYTGNFMFMFQLGLPGAMYDEWLNEPINVRKQPFYFYLRWRWRNHWYHQWLTFSSRMIYRRTSLYRWRDFILNQTSRSNLIYQQYFRLVYQSRYYSLAQRYFFSQTKIVDFYRQLILQATLTSQTVVKQTATSWSQRIKDQQKELTWSRPAYISQTYHQRGKKKIAQVKSRLKLYKTRFSQWLLFNQRQPQPLTVVNYQPELIQNFFPDLSVANRYTHYQLIDQQLLTLNSGIDDLDFFGQDSSDFEEQQDESIDFDDEPTNYDYLFGLRRDFEPADIIHWGVHKIPITNFFPKVLSRRKRWRLTKLKRRQRYSKLNFNDFVSFNYGQPTVFDSEFELPSGDGPSVVDDEFDFPEVQYDDIENEFGPRRGYQLVDWYQVSSEDQRLTDRAVYPHRADRLFFWNTNQYVRAVDEQPRQNLRTIKNWLNFWTYTDKKRLVRPNPDHFPKRKTRSRRRQLKKFHRRLQFRGRDRKTRFRWSTFFLFNYGSEFEQKSAAVHQKFTSDESQPWEILGVQSRAFFRQLPLRSRTKFNFNHSQHLAAEADHSPFYAQVQQRDQPYYASRYLLNRIKRRFDFFQFRYEQHNKNRHSDKKNSLFVNFFKARLKKRYSRLEIMLNFLRPRSSMRWRIKALPSNRYFNNRPQPRRGLQPPMHYPRYHHVYNQNRVLNEELTGNQQSLGNNNFWLTSIPGIGWFWFIAGILFMDDVWSQFEWWYNQPRLV